MVDGRPYQDVKAEVIKILQGKLVITCGGEDDLQGFELSRTQFTNFDLHDYWFERYNNQHGQLVEEPIGLKHIYHHYFKKDIQQGIHSAFVDAKATMRIFRFIYLPEAENKNIINKENPTPWEHFPRLKH